MSSYIYDDDAAKIRKIPWHHVSSATGINHSGSGMTGDIDVIIIGGGILGLATALRILQARPVTRLILLEKEPHLAQHQTGHNSGVIHSGLYYKPGSLKAI